MNHSFDTNIISRRLAKPMACVSLIALCAAFMGLNASAANRPFIHTAAAGSHINQSPQNPGTCLIDISTIGYTPALAYDGSGGNVLFNGSKPNVAACRQEAISQWNNALATGWSPANRCTINANGPSDEILTEITYSFNGGPTIRADGYGTMCSPHVNVQAPNY